MASFGSLNILWVSEIHRNPGIWDFGISEIPNSEHSEIADSVRSVRDRDLRIFYCDPCDTPVNGREDPVNLGDGNSETKWLDYSRNGFYVKQLGPGKRYCF